MVKAKVWCLFLLFFLLFFGRVELCPGLRKSLGVGLKETIITHCSNQISHGFALVRKLVCLCESSHFEFSGFLCEGLECFFGLGQVQRDSADGLSEPWLVTTIGGTSITRLSDRRSSSNTPVTGTHSTEFALSTITSRCRNVSVVLAIVQIKGHGQATRRANSECGRGESRRRGGSDSKNSKSFHGEFRTRVDLNSNNIKVKERTGLSVG
mmetsp:Transcript_13751/g.17945  ORF Transcript_13751/g.17945 Transcript_13751/m.17945 type:complete len:210 (-) Transcript_13751:65-694(-)